MSDRYVRNLRFVEEWDGRQILIGVDYDTVTVGEYRLTRAQCEEFARAFVAACWEAADNARLMAEEGSA